VLPAAIFMAAGGCAPVPFRPALDRAAQSITLAGSTSVQPFAELLAEEFMKDHPSIVANIQGGGSSAGARAALTGVAHIGMLSRELRDEEKALFSVVIAQDAIAIVVHPTNPADDLDVRKIQAIFSGEISNWAEVGGPKHPIHIVTREEGSGTRGAFDEIIMGNAEVTPGAIVQDSNGAVRETVAGDVSAIGYLSLGLVDRRIKSVQVSGVAPSIENVRNGTYRVVRPMLFATRGRPSGNVRLFIDFCLSETGQRQLASEGLVPVASTAFEDRR